MASPKEIIESVRKTWGIGLSDRSAADRGLRVDTVRCFKGLEAGVVFLWGIDSTPSQVETRAPVRRNLPSEVAPFSGRNARVLPATARLAVPRDYRLISSRIPNPQALPKIGGSSYTSCQRLTCINPISVVATRLISPRICSSAG